MMKWRSHSRPRWAFALRTWLRLVWCHGCGVRYQRTGVLTLIEGRLLQWACVRCYMLAFRRAQG